MIDLQRHIVQRVRFLNIAVRVQSFYEYSVVRTGVRDDGIDVERNRTVILCGKVIERRYAVKLVRATSADVPSVIHIADSKSHRLTPIGHLVGSGEGELCHDAVHHQLQRHPLRRRELTTHEERMRNLVIRERNHAIRQRCRPVRLMRHGIQRVGFRQVQCHGQRPEPIVTRSLMEVLRRFPIRNPHIQVRAILTDGGSRHLRYLIRREPNRHRVPLCRLLLVVRHFLITATRGHHKCNRK